MNNLTYIAMVTKTLEICLSTIAMHDRIYDLERHVMLLIITLLERRGDVIMDVVNEIDQEQRRKVGDKATARKGYSMYIHTLAMEEIADRRDGITEEVEHEIQNR